MKTYTMPDGFQITIVNEKEPKEKVSEKTVFEEMLKNTEKNLEKNELQE